MSTLSIAGLLFGFLALLLGAGVWVAVSLAIVGGVGLLFFTDTSAGQNLFMSFWGSNESWELAALPMFIWMGEILFRTKISEQMFDGLGVWLNRVPGRLLHTTILGCGIFGSVSGSSAATCATISKVALPQLKRRGYDESIALGSLATAGTLGLLIPPSIAMVVYAVAAETSIIRVFLAGFLPGLLLMVLFSGYIALWAIRHPELQPPAEARLTFRQKLAATRNLIPVSMLIAFIVAALMTGWATATDCAAFGVFGSLVIAAMSRTLTWRNFRDGLFGAVRTSCMIMFILAAAKFLSVAMAFTGIPKELAAWVASMELSPSALLFVLTLIYILLGAALDGISMIVLTAAVVIPMVQRAGIDLVWFGIFVVLLVEIAEVTPPLGFNLFVLQSMTGKDSMTVSKAAIPFFVCLLICVLLITIFPQIVMWLPNKVMGPG